MVTVARPCLKASAAAITLGTGNSLGPEGPSVEIGRATARGLGEVLKSKQRRLLSLVAAGSGAGVLAVMGGTLHICSTPCRTSTMCTSYDHHSSE